MQWSRRSLSLILSGLWVLPAHLPATPASSVVIDVSFQTLALPLRDTFRRPGDVVAARQIRQTHSLLRQALTAGGIAAMSAFTIYHLVNRFFVRPALNGHVPPGLSPGKTIDLSEALYLNYIYPFVREAGMQGQRGIYVLNHPYRHALDGYIFMHHLYLKTRRVPKVLVTGDKRGLWESAERSLLEYLGIAVIVPNTANGSRRASGGLTDKMITLLNQGHDVVIFPGRSARANRESQLKNWSRSAVFASRATGLPMIPVAVGGMPLDWSPLTAIEEGRHALHHPRDPQPPTFYIREGHAVYPEEKEADDTRDRLVSVMRDLLNTIPVPVPDATLRHPEEGLLELRDGRELPYIDLKPDGPVQMTVFYMHGLQGSLLEMAPGLPLILNRLGVRWIAMDRPAVGLATPKPSYSVPQWRSDIQQLKEHLLQPGERFSVIGHSAGTPYALQTALLPGAVALALVSPIPPLGVSWKSIRWLSEKNKRLFVGALLTPRKILRLAASLSEMVRAQWTDYEAHAQNDLPDADARILMQADMRGVWKMNRQRGYWQGGRSILSEIHALLGDWGVSGKQFSKIPALIWHGALDPHVLPEAARYYRMFIPNSGVEILPDRGHHFIYDQIGSILAALKAMHLSTLSAGSPYLQQAA